MEDIGSRNLVDVKGSGRSMMMIRSQNRLLSKAGGNKHILPKPGPVDLNMY